MDLSKDPRNTPSNMELWKAVCEVYNAADDKCKELLHFNVNHSSVVNRGCLLPPCYLAFYKDGSKL